MDSKESKAQEYCIQCDNNRVKRAALTQKSYQIVCDALSELLKASKELIANLEDAEEDKDDDGNVYPDISRLKRAITRIEARNH